MGPHEAPLQPLPEKGYFGWSRVLSCSVEIPRSRQDADVPRMPVRRVSRRLRVSDDIGACELDVGFVVF